MTNFNTDDSSDSTTALISYISNVTNGSIIVGVTLDEPWQYLAPAFQQLSSFGVNTSQLNFRSSFAFVAQVFGGQGQASYVAVTKPNGLDSAQMIVQVQGIVVCFFLYNCNFT